MAQSFPKRNRFRWAILALISASHIIGAAAQYGINTLAPFYKDELGLSRAQVGLFFSAFYLAMTAASFGAGWLADRLGVRQTSLQGHLILGVCTVAAALAPSFTWACVSFFLAGAGYSFLNPASTKGVMAWFYRDERATAMGIKQTGVPAGGVVTAMLAPALVLFMGWRGALAALGVINFLFGFLFYFFWRDSAEDPVKQDSVELPSQDAAAPLKICESSSRQLRYRDLFGRADGFDHLHTALSERCHGLFTLLGKSGSRPDASGRDGRPHRLGCGQRPVVWRAAQDRFDPYRRVVGNFNSGVEFDVAPIVLLFIVAGSVFGGPLSGWISRSVLRADR